MDILDGFPHFGKEIRDRDKLMKLSQKYGILRIASEGKNPSVADAIRIIEAFRRTIEKATFPEEYYYLLK